MDQVDFDQQLPKFEMGLICTTNLNLEMYMWAKPVGVYFLSSRLGICDSYFEFWKLCKIFLNIANVLTILFDIFSPFSFIGSGFGIANWDFLGSTMLTNTHIRLTPNEQSFQGAIWNTHVRIHLFAVIKFRY